MPGDGGTLAVASDCAIPLRELRWSFSRSSGSGGQNVNKLNTRVTLYFDLDGSPSLSGEQKQRVHQALAGRINRAGVLYLSVEDARTQGANRALALRRFQSLIAGALVRDARRKPTTLSRAVRKRRQRNKEAQSRRKAQRRWSPAGE